MSLVFRLGKVSVKSGLLLWKTLLRPILEYGAAVWETERDHKWEDAECLQRMVLKRILRCGKTMSDEVVLGELGVWKLRRRRQQIRLVFWAKILAMDKSRWVRRVYEEGRKRMEKFHSPDFE